MKLKKIDIIREWDNSELRKKYGLRLSYHNMEECYNDKKQINGFILYKGTERFYFTAELKENKVLIQEDVFENYEERLEFERELNKDNIILIY